MLRRMTLKQYMEWRCYADLEPFDEVRSDLRAASIVQAIANAFRDTKKHPKGFPLSDFVLQFGKAETRTQQPLRKPWEQLKAIGKAMAEAFSSPRKKAQNAR